MAHTYGSAPMEFDGTDEERRANFDTHHFGYGDRCYNCDCRPWGRHASWPCGVEVVRVPLTSPDEADYITIGAAAYGIANGTV